MIDFSKAQEVCDSIISAVSKYFVGDEFLMRKVLAPILANGHVLFEDNPGLGKTLLAKLFSRTVGMKFSRIQFTPDLLPADVVGTKIWNRKSFTFETVKGPIFSNFLLADEINRSPPKTQSALLEAMEERQVTLEGETFTLNSPFFVMATQNPIEQEGTYPLPEAQLDRFLTKFSTGYPSNLDREKEVLRRRITWKKNDPTEYLKPVANLKTFRKLQSSVESDVFVHEEILGYISQIVRKIREHNKVEVGPSPRGCLALLRVSRAFALSLGRDFVTPDDIKAFCEESLSHRTLLEIDEILEGVSPQQIVEEVVESIPVPKRYRQNSARSPSSTTKVDARDDMVQ